MRYLITSYFLFFSILIYTQQNKTYGFSTFKKQDKSFITANLRGKHSVSIGISNSINSPFDENLIPLIGGHIGYNYLILSKKDKYKKKKNITKSRTIINTYLGVQLDIFTKGEFLVNVKLYHPLIRTKGLIFTWLFFNEIGIGVHQRPSYLNPTNTINPNLSLEFLRIKFYKAPLFITLGSNYDLKNDFSVPEPKNIEFMFSLKYFVFKNKVN